MFVEAFPIANRGASLAVFKLSSLRVMRASLKFNKQGGDFRLYYTLQKGKIKHRNVCIYNFLAPLPVYSLPATLLIFLFQSPAEQIIGIRC